MDEQTQRGYKVSKLLFRVLKSPELEITQNKKNSNFNRDISYNIIYTVLIHKYHD